MLKLSIAIILILVLAASAATGQVAVRIKDIAHVDGVRSNQLVGYGLIVGLNNTGDSQQAIFTMQSVANLLQAFGIASDPSTLRVRNVAAVMVTADLPAFARPGDKDRRDLLVNGRCHDPSGRHSVADAACGR